MTISKSLSFIFLIFLFQGASFVHTKFIECPKERSEDDVNIYHPCFFITRPVCAHFNDCTGNDCQEQTIENACSACYDSRADYYSEGKCSNDETETEEAVVQGPIYWCRNIKGDLNFDSDCNLEYEPVCAYTVTIGESIGLTIGNACRACAKLGLDYYTAGPCGDEGAEGGEEEWSEEGWCEEEIQWITELEDGIMICDLREGDDVECPLEADPVCSYYAKDGKFARHSYRNECSACNSKTNYYTKGACPGDEDNEDNWWM